METTDTKVHGKLTAPGTVMRDIKANDIFVGYIEALGCNGCLRRRDRYLAIKNRQTSEPYNTAPWHQSKDLSTFLHANSDASTQNATKFSNFNGSYFAMSTPLHLVTSFDATDADHLALMVDGATKLYGDFEVMDHEGGDESFYVTSSQISAHGESCKTRFTRAIFNLS
jgi:hypothetical protein